MTRLCIISFPSSLPPPANLTRDRMRRRASYHDVVNAIHAKLRKTACDDNRARRQADRWPIAIRRAAAHAGTKEQWALLLVDRAANAAACATIRCIRVRWRRDGPPRNAGLLTRALARFTSPERRYHLHVDEQASQQAYETVEAQFCLAASVAKDARAVTAVLLRGDSRGNSSRALPAREAPILRRMVAGLARQARALDLRGNRLDQAVHAEGWRHNHYDPRYDNGSYEHTDARHQSHPPDGWRGYGTPARPEYALGLADGLQTNRAMTSLNVRGCCLGQMFAPDVLPTGWFGPNIYGEYYHETEWAVPGTKPLGVIALANAVRGSRLVRLDLSENDLCAAGARAMAAGLRNHCTLAELNLGFNDNLTWDPQRDVTDFTGLRALAATVPTMGALTSLNVSGISSNGLPAERLATLLPVIEALRDNQRVQELNLSYNDTNDALNDVEGGAIRSLADVVPTMGALTSLHLRRMGLGGGDVQALADAIPKCK